MHHFITGTAGFIGSQLADALLAAGDTVSGIDDLSLGRLDHLEAASRSQNFKFINADCNARHPLQSALQQVIDWAGHPDLVWHLAANSDIPAGIQDQSVDLKRTFLTTFTLVEVMRTLGLRNVAFASTSAIYGDCQKLLTEEHGPLLPISNYGAMKLASEALLSASAESFLDHIWVFRFPNVVGPRATHGAIFDFISRLRADSTALHVLGDGSQTKPYLHVSELISAMRFIIANAKERRNVFNIGPEGTGTSVSFIAERTVDIVAKDAKIIYADGDRGWVGDVPRVAYSAQRLKALGWTPVMSSDHAVLKAIRELAEV